MCLAQWNGLTLVAETLDPSGLEHVIGNNMFDVQQDTGADVPSTITITLNVVFKVIGAAVASDRQRNKVAREWSKDLLQINSEMEETRTVADRQ